MAKKKVPAKPQQTVAPSIPMELPAGMKAKRQVIMPTLNLSINVGRILRIDDAMRVSTYKDPDPKKSLKPATICGVTDIQTGEQFILLVPTVMESSLKEGYPDDDYVGKVFYAEKLPKRAGKRYHDFKLVEVDASDYTPDKF